MAIQFGIDALIMTSWRIDYIGCFCNPRRQHSAIGCVSSMDFEAKAGLAEAGVNRTGNAHDAVVALIRGFRKI